jgi:PPOX class probable F420-dependent enzyme
MPASRTAIAMSAAEVTEFIAGGRTLVLVTLGPDGLPDPVPMWYVVDDSGTIAMRTYRKSQKVVNLRRDSRVAALLEDGSRYTQLRGVQLTGRVELVEDDDVVADIMVGLLRKYERLAAQDVDAARVAALQRAPKQVAMRLRIDAVASWDHRKLSS